MSKKLKIVLISYVFFPHTTPRAFRVFELAKYFIEKGHDVTVYTSDNGSNYGEFKTRFGLNVIKVRPGFLFNRKCPYPVYLRDYKETKEIENSDKNKKVSLLRTIMRKCYSFPVFQKLYHKIYLGGDSFEFSFTLFRELVKDKNEYDLMISVGLPVCSHIGSALSLLFNRRLAKTAVADYGDPFSCNMSIKDPGWLHPFIEKNFLRMFDYVTVPIKEAIPAYDRLGVKEKISVIPQGMNFRNYKRTESLIESKIPHFAYAGSFMIEYRNPERLLVYLSSLNKDFRFIVYTSLRHQNVIELLEKYKEIFGEKLIINDLLPREKCIYELSRFHFLVNINNLTSCQSPSKLIDYTLTGRPVFSMTQNEINFDRLESFINGDYSEYYPEINLEDYDINTVGQKFLDLARNI